MAIPFEDLEIGHTIRTHSRTLTEADVVNFAGVSGDFNPWHLSDRGATGSAFEGRVVHGALLVAVCTGLLWQHRHERPDTVAFYGIDDLRFREPVTVGDTVHAEAELVEKRPYDHPEATGWVSYATDLVVDGDPVMSALFLSLVR
ncbi:MAG: MaoC/PaaZ C-terminal domain-containing protein [Halobacteriota archaeon]